MRTEPPAESQAPQSSSIQHHNWPFILSPSLTKQAVTSREESRDGIGR